MKRRAAISIAVGRRHPSAASPGSRLAGPSPRHANAGSEAAWGDQLIDICKRLKFSRRSEFSRLNFTARKRRTREGAATPLARRQAPASWVLPGAGLMRAAKLRGMASLSHFSKPKASNSLALKSQVATKAPIKFARHAIGASRPERRPPVGTLRFDHVRVNRGWSESRMIFAAAGCGSIRDAPCR
jgi:hypothetical protein